MLRIITIFLGLPWVLAQLGCADTLREKFPYADRAYESAMVCARVTVSARGELEEFVVLRSTGDARLNARVRYDVSRGQFAPRQLNGKPVESTYVVAIAFHPQGTLKNPVSGPVYSEEQAKEYCRDISDQPLGPNQRSRKAVT